MSRKRKTFSPEFKTKVVLEVLEGNATINEIASKYNILPKSVQQWKKQFLENASLAFESSVPLKKYKEEIKEKDKKIDELYKALGKTQIERDWVLKKLRSRVPAKMYFCGMLTAWRRGLEEAWWSPSSKSLLSPGNVRC